MQFSRFALIFLAVSSVLTLNAQDKPAAQTEPAKAEAPAAQDQSSTDQSAANPPSGVAVDAVKVTGTTFESPYFKFTYELPAGWKTLERRRRAPKPTGRQFRKTLSEPRWRGLRPERRLRKRRQRISQPRSPNPTPQHSPVVPERYSLLAASPDGLDSLASPVLPRINIWAHRRIPPLDTADGPCPASHFREAQRSPGSAAGNQHCRAPVRARSSWSIRQENTTPAMSRRDRRLSGRFRFSGRSPSGKWPSSRTHQEHQVRITIPRTSVQAFSSAVGRNLGALRALSGVLEPVSDLEQCRLAPCSAEERNAYRQPEHVAGSDVDIRISRHRGRIGAASAEVIARQPGPSPRPGRPSARSRHQV